MNTKNNPNFDYSASYFQTGMVGWHALSFPLITARFEEFSKGKHFGSGLDFGCGDGFYGVFLRRHVERLHGTDVSDCIEDPEKRAAYYEFMQNDLGTMLDTEGNAFDVIFSSEVIEHVSDYRQFMKNAFHLLKSEGYIFMTTTTFACGLPIYLIQHPKRWSTAALIQFSKGFMGNESARTIFLTHLWTWTKGHYHGFSKRQLRNALVEIGYEIETIEYIHAQPFIYTDFFWNPFKQVKLRWLVIPVARTLGCFAALVNFICRKFDLYAPNVVVIARKPAGLVIGQ